ncbi:MAG TPA: hypothetical protein VM163_11950 [bacterium]|nr:hypothetical protein [bacterium]
MQNSAYHQACTVSDNLSILPIFVLGKVSRNSIWQLFVRYRPVIREHRKLVWNITCRLD